MVTLQVEECSQLKTGEGIVICSAATQNDLIQHVTLMKTHKDAIASKKLRVLLTSAFKQDALLSKLKVYGFEDILPEPVDEMKLALRIDRIAREMTASPEVILNAEESIRLLPALKLQSDFWLFQRQGTHRMVDRWVVKMIGPGPAAGQFMPVEETGNGGEEQGPATKKVDSGWKWVPTTTGKEEFLKEDGTWYFRGQSARFDREAWYFSGKNIELSFRWNLGEASAGTKFTTDPSGVLCVTYDSLNAVRLRSQIDATLYDSKKKNEMAPGIFKLDSEEIQNAPPTEFSNNIRNRLETAFGEPSPEALEILARLDKKAVSRPQIHENSPLKPQGPAAIQVKKSFEPRLGPLSLALLMSELACKPELTKEEMARRFCSYVGAACGGGMRVELWYVKGGQWQCAGTSDGTAPTDASIVSSLSRGAARLGNGTVAGTIEDASQHLLGALVISGEGMGELSLEYVLAAGAMTRGLVESFVHAELDRSPLPQSDAA